MSFLDNSGDIILDAVLTDTGRQRIARGDGSFEISKFVFGDDEIDYGKYDKDNPNGSSHFDLEILKTPVLEAVTDNASAIKNRLVSISRNDLLYLPEMKLNETEGTKRRESGDAAGSFVVAVNEQTEDLFDFSGANVQGIMAGESPSKAAIRAEVDQGLDNGKSPNTDLDPELVETQYIVEIDNRLGKIIPPNSTDQAQPSYIDDDNIASYFFTQGTDSNFVSEIDDNGSAVINGPTGTRFTFRVASTQELSDSDFLFDQLGTTSTVNGNDVKHIDTNVRIIGGSTGRTIDIPFRYIKDNS